MSPAIGAVSRILVHETLAILATDLRDLLLGHLTLWRHPVSRHGLTISRTPVGWVGIVSRIVSGRTITLWHRITWRRSLASAVACYSVEQMQPVSGPSDPACL